MSEKHTQGRLHVGFRDNMAHSPVAWDAPRTFDVSNICRADGGHVAFVKSAEDARRLVACWNALIDVPTEWLEQAAQIGITDVTSGNLFSSRLKLQAQRDDLLVALERLSFAAMARDNTMGDQCRLIEVKAELSAANKQACAAIAKVKGGAV